MYYPFVLTTDSSGTIHITSPQFPAAKAIADDPKGVADAARTLLNEQLIQHVVGGLLFPKPPTVFPTSVDWVLVDFDWQGVIITSLHNRRLEKKITIQVLAGLADMNETVVARLFNPNKITPLDHYQAVARALDLKLSVLPMF